MALFTDAPPVAINRVLGPIREWERTVEMMGRGARRMRSFRMELTKDESKILSIRPFRDKLTLDQRSYFHLLRAVPGDLVVGLVVPVIAQDARQDLQHVVVQGEVAEVTARRAFQQLVEYPPAALRRLLQYPLARQGAVFKATSSEESVKLIN